MTAKYYTLVTDAGLDKEARAKTEGKAVVLTHIALGDGDYDPEPGFTTVTAIYLLSPSIRRLTSLC